jgi:protein-S-isoprenylcysteine O-methyltransferase Ste14
VMNAQMLDHQKRAWTRIWCMIIVGLALALIGMAFGFIFSNPIPLIVAAMGWLVVVIALWMGGQVERTIPEG